MEIVLSTLNARYIHASFGLRYLRANLGELRDRSTIREFTINERPIDIVEQLLDGDPKIVGFGVYIWNVRETLATIQILKAVSPGTTIVIGGPEVSHEYVGQSIVEAADYLIVGEADVAFAALCDQLLNGEAPPSRIIRPTLPEVADLEFPYGEYSDEDVAHRISYVEASRGCPFRCEFCLSSLDKSVRSFDVDRFLNEMESLHLRGVRHFKFVDRTFNLKLDASSKILRFFLDRPDTVVHFEMVPDRMPEALRQIVSQYEPGRLQFEVGIQTFNPEVAKRISRRQNYEKLEDNFEFLRDQTDVHVHADLIVGLPGETMESFAEGFDRLVRLGPEEIQVGILKRLNGTPITRHSEAFAMVYETRAPYALLQSSEFTFAQMQRMKRFARYWDLVANSGNFIETTPQIWGDASPFWRFLKLSDWLFAETQATHRIALDRLVGLLLRYLVELGQEESAAGAMLLRDFQRAGRPKVPNSLKHLGLKAAPIATSHGPLKRQSRHAGPQ